MNVTKAAEHLHNALVDILRTHSNYLSIKGGRVPRAAAEHEVRGLQLTLDELQRQVDRYERAYELLHDDLVDWELDLDKLRTMIAELEVAPEVRDDIGDVLDWVDKANALYQPKWRG